MECTATVPCGAVAYLRRSCPKHDHIQQHRHDVVAVFAMFRQIIFQSGRTCFKPTAPLRWLQRISFAPNVGLEPTTPRLRVSCSTDWANRADFVYSKQIFFEKEYCCFGVHYPGSCLHASNFKNVFQFNSHKISIGNCSMECTAFVLYDTLSYLRKSCTKHDLIQQHCHDVVALFGKFRRTLFLKLDMYFWSLMSPKDGSKGLDLRPMWGSGPRPWD